MTCDSMPSTTSRLGVACRSDPHLITCWTAPAYLRDDAFRPLFRRSRRLRPRLQVGPSLCRLSARSNHSQSCRAASKPDQRLCLPASNCIRVLPDTPRSLTGSWICSPAGVKHLISRPVSEQPLGSPKRGSGSAMGAESVMKPGLASGRSSTTMRLPGCSTPLAHRVLEHPQRGSRVPGCGAVADGEVVQKPSGKAPTPSGLSTPQ